MNNIFRKTTYLFIIKYLIIYLFMDLNNFKYNLYIVFLRRINLRPLQIVTKRLLFLEDGNMVIV
jgi:hypothetical protein